MQLRTTPRRRAAASLGTLAMVAVTLVGLPGTASASVVEGDHRDQCVEDAHGHASSSARGGYGPDHRSISATEQREIERRTDRILDAQKGKPGATTVNVPVYVHVMRAADGVTGDVTDTQITQQIAVLNATYGGTESDVAANTSFRFTLAGVDRFDNDSWHQDKSSSNYRKATRQGGKNALNMWLVDFKYLGIATFPWDYSKQPGIDGVRVHYASLPGGAIANYNLGETATHEVGHWLGLYHTFQGGCTETNDEVSDTPAQASPSTGCPEGNDTCPAPGTDPIHNYMDYSYDSCYTEFTSGQSARMDQMWAAYRA